MDHSVPVLQFAEARASEIATLMKEVTSSERHKKKTFFQKLPHHMRRRGASHNPKRVPKNLRGNNTNSTAKATSKAKHKKKPKDLQAEYASRSTTDKTWLETHIWHAKRFKMEKMWGYSLPVHSNERKLGSSHKTAAYHAMLQDLSYYCCIELEGSEEILLNHLSALTDSSSGHTFASDMFLDGTKEGLCFLFHPNTCPYGGIGSVSFLWRPSSFASDLHQKTSVVQRQLWIFCHPSFHNELVQVLINVFEFKEIKTDVVEADENKMEISDDVVNSEKNTVVVGEKRFRFACKLNFSKTQQHFCKETRYSHQTTKMVLRKNTLTRHRLIGPMTAKVLNRVLKLANVGDCSDSENGSSPKKMKTGDGVLAEARERWWESYYRSEDMKLIHEQKEDLLDCLKDAQSSYYILPRSVIGLTVRDPRLLESVWRNENEDESTEDDVEDYSDIGELLTPETSDSALWDEDIRNEVTAAKLSDREINDERSKCISSIDLGKRENKVPILIVHQSGLNGFGSGWDVIAPLGWSLEFWRSFERKGGRPAGLRDIHFVNLESGRPSFPCSFPDTKSGSEYEEKLRVEALKKHRRHPKSKRPNFSILGIATPFFICWKTLVDDWEKELIKEEVRALFPCVESMLGIGFSNGNDPSTVGCNTEFYVFRGSLLWKVHELFRKLKRSPKTGFSREEVYRFKEICDGILQSIKPSMKVYRSLVLVKVQCLNKGRPSSNVGIYLLNKSDFEDIRRNPHFPGPIEPNHPKAKSESKSLERPVIESLISVSSRQMIGHVSEGGFNSVCGQGYAVGHCAMVGFFTVVKQCLEVGLPPLVLVREQHSFKYRVASVDIIENYLL